MGHCNTPLAAVQVGNCSEGTYWSLHAYPHLVSTQGMFRYASTSWRLNSVRLDIEPLIRSTFECMDIGSVPRVGEVGDDPDLFPGAFLHPGGHIELCCLHERWQGAKKREGLPVPSHKRQRQQLRTSERRLESREDLPPDMLMLATVDLLFECARDEPQHCTSGTQRFALGENRTPGEHGRPPRQ